MYNNFEFIIDENQVKRFGLPCNLIHNLINLLKNNVGMFYVCFNSGNKAVNKYISDAVYNFIKFNNLQFRIIIENNLKNANIIKLNNDNIFFSSMLNENKIFKTPNLLQFIDDYESVLGKLPFYTQENKYTEKFAFLNNSVLGFGEEISSH